MGEEGTGRSDSQTAKSPSAGRYIDPLPEQGRRIAPNKKEKQRRTDVEGEGGKVTKDEWRGRVEKR